MMRHLFILLVVGAACYGAVNWLYRQVDSGSGIGDVSVGAGDTAGERRHDEAGGEGGALDTAVITRRNIFLSPAGTGAGGGSDPLALPGQSAPEILLVGTVVHSDGSHRAVLYRVEDKKQLLVKEGDAVNGISIKQILPGKTIVSRRGRSETLDMVAAAEFRRAQQPASSALSGPNAALIPAGRPARKDTADSVLPVEAGPGDEAEPQNVRVDPGDFGKNSDDIIIKGRISQ